MDFSFSPEQDGLRSVARDFLSDSLPAHRMAELANSASGWDPATWPRLAGMGWLDADLTFLDLAVLAEESGAALLPAPWLGTVTAARNLLSEGHAVRAAVADGGVRLAAGATEVALDVDEATGTASATIVGIADLRWATHAVLPLAGSDRVALVDLDDDRARVTELDSLDATRPVGTLRLEHCPVELVESPARPSAAMRYLAVLACEALGVGRTALALGVEHAGARVQFGRPLGVYQGVSHRLAHTFQNLELAKSLTYRAAWSVEAHPALSAVDCALIAGAALRSGAMAVDACENTLQVLGGIGMTWDHPLHRWYKRALASRGIAAQLVSDSKALDGLGDGTVPTAA